MRIFALVAILLVLIACKSSSLPLSTPTTTPTTTIGMETTKSTLPGKAIIQTFISTPTPTPTILIQPLVSPDIISQASPSVVRIDTGGGTGTGFIFETENETAYVLTNSHVVNKESIIDVIVNDKTLYKGTVLGNDNTRDLAVLTICCSIRFKALDFDDSTNYDRGTEISVLGYALAWEGEASLAVGIISAKRWEPKYQANVIQTDAALHPGHSGSPMLTEEGKVIGIIAYRLSKENIAFAISEKTIRERIQILKSTPPTGNENTGEIVVENRVKDRPTPTPPINLFPREIFETVVPDESSTTPSQTPSPTPSGPRIGSEDNPVPFNEYVVIYEDNEAQWKLAIIDIEKVEERGNYLKEEDKVYVLITIKVQSLIFTPQYFRYDLVMWLEAGRRWYGGGSPILSGSPCNQLLEYFTELSKGETLEGEICYHIKSEDNNDLKIYLSHHNAPNNPFDSGVWFSLKK